LSKDVFLFAFALQTHLLGRAFIKSYLRATRAKPNNFLDERSSSLVYNLYLLKCSMPIQKLATAPGGDLKSGNLVYHATVFMSLVLPTSLLYLLPLVLCYTFQHWGSPITPLRV